MAGNCDPYQQIHVKYQSEGSPEQNYIPLVEDFGKHTVLISALEAEVLLIICGGGHFGGHLGYFKMLKGAILAPLSFSISRSSGCRNSQKNCADATFGFSVLAPH